MHEIERKFLVTKPLTEIVGNDNDAFYRNVEQCYLPDTGEWTVRVRRYTSPTGHFMNAVQTMKRKVNDRKCIELEHAVTQEYFEKVMGQCGKVLRKQRWQIMFGAHVWEIDYFPQFDGLVVAEIELEDEEELFIHPDWLGKEVTQDKSYKNARMARRLK